MDEVFVVMHLSPEVLDTFYKKAIEPMLNKLGLKARYVDHNERKAAFIHEIERHIDEAAIVIGDLTNMRPNCYYEIGYAVGRLSHGRVILTARDDHRPECGPNKVHSDLTPFDIEWWDPDQLPAFTAKLKAEVLSRLSRRGNRTDRDESSWIAPKWLDECRGITRTGLKQNPKLIGSVEAFWTPAVCLEYVDQVTLAEAVEGARIRDADVRAPSEWSIGVSGASELQRQPDGIRAEVRRMRGQYEFWSLKQDGSFYVGKSLGEDVSFDTPFLCLDQRIAVVAEILAFCHRLNSRLHLRDGIRLRIHLEHAGLAGRQLTALDAARGSLGAWQTTEEKGPVSWTKDLAFGSLKAAFLDLVMEACGGLLGMFDFRPRREDYQNLVAPFEKCLDAGGR